MWTRIRVDVKEIMESFFFAEFVLLICCIYTGWNRDREQMGCMKLCHITPAPGQRPSPVVPHCSGPHPCSGLDPGSAQYEYTILVEASVGNNKPRISVFKVGLHIEFLVAPAAESRAERLIF